MSGLRQKILVVEDNRDIGNQVVELLESEGYYVKWIRDGTEALRARPDAYHLIVLDLMLPGAHGLDVLKSFRERADTPVLILSARGETDDKVRGLELGADDYLTKPFWPEELVARVRSRLRRPIMQRAGRLVFGELVIVTGQRSVSVGGLEIQLTVAEFDLLLALATRAGAAVTRERLAEEVLDEEQNSLQRTLDSHVSRLRKKLGEESGRVETVWGIGYRLRVEEA